MVSARHARVRSRGFLLSVFVALAALFACLDLVAMRRATVVRRQTRELVQDALAGVDLVSRIGCDLERMRLLVDAHIFESEELPWNRMEARIGEAQRDAREASRAYDVIAASDAAEQSLWRGLRADLASLDQPVADALELSRRNLDAEARRAVAKLEPRFSAVDQKVMALVALNRAHADQLVERAETLQRASVRWFAGLAALGIIISLVVGAWVTRRVTGAERRLLESSARLEEQNRELDAFAGRVAHDLRGHLSVITLASGTLSRGGDQPRALRLLRRGVQRMHTLIEDLLTLSRLDGRQRSVCNPRAAMVEVQEDLAERVEHEAGSLFAELEPALVGCSEGLLRQVLLNLIDNAIKYRRDEVPLRIDVEGVRSGRGYLLQVRDNGMGMSPDEARSAFEPLYRGTRVGDRNGSGLGLSIVRRIVEVSGGRITLASEPGCGTRFDILLPVA
jgi:signal transduction histidine kinase